MRLDWHWATDRQLGNGFEHFKRFVSVLDLRTDSLSM